MDQYFVTDTNIYLLDALEAIYSFAPKRNDIRNFLIIPYVVLEEIDSFKKEQHSSRGLNAHLFSRELKKISQTKKQKLSKGVEISKNYYVKVEYDYNDSLEKKLLRQYHGKENDNIILSIANTIKERNKGEVELVTNDSNLFIKAESIGLNASDWRAAKSIEKYRDIYKGWREITVEDKIIDYFISSKQAMPLEELNIESLIPNEYLILKSSNYKINSFKEGELNNRDFVLVSYKKRIIGLKNGGYIKVPYLAGKKSNILGINSRNIQQSLALNALLRRDIRLVNLIGPAGTGKTILSVATGLYQLRTNNSRKKNNIYETLVIGRPNISMGPELGYLPGNIKEKMEPWMNPIFDNITGTMKEELVKKIHNSPTKRKALSELKSGEMEDYLLDNEFIEIQPLQHIRGRSRENVYMIIDEAQNLDPLEVKTIITRIGDNSKIILTGDPQQIDKKGLNELTNGLCFASERMKLEEITATIFLKDGERSKLATLGSKLL
ncbi:hypothetical protein CMO90_03885 [Candidatus Woesearchaeota archaeon]|jgi:PhoH-like ATPase|nr:hypothetical protein [Candidatus Woesearchaeota archaeon]